MAVLTRDQLVAKFKTNVIPSEDSFRDLIDSTLNMCDDDFFGRWKYTHKYYAGDVVIHNNTLYKLRPDPNAPDDSQEDVEPQKMKKAANGDSDGETDKEGTPYCSAKRPDQDSGDDGRWEKLTFDLKDEDWEYEEDNTLVAMNPNARVGIGTKNPGGKLHVEEEGRGKLIFNPCQVHASSHEKADTDPVLKLEWEPFPDCDTSFVQIRQQEAATQIETTAESGILIHHVDEGQEASGKLAAFTPAGAGIGTHEPQASLDVKTDEVGRFKVNPSEQENVTVRLENKDGYSATESVDEGGNTFRTDAKGGFKFLPAAETENKNGGARVVTIDQSGHVGIGTEAPACELEVVKPESGKISASVGRTNPSLSVVNLRPAGKTSYLTAGADNSFAVLKTDAECGFVFKRGADHDPEKMPEKDLSGDHLVYIDQDGKVGVGKSPEGYEVDVKGKVQTNELYLPTNETTIEETGEIENALEVVCNLTPILFKWRQQDDALSDRDQYGLRARECDEYTPEAVTHINKGQLAIAYQNMVPLLIKAIQEQQAIIDELRSSK